MTETIEQQNVLQTDRMKNGITTELQNDRMTEKQNDKTTELQNDRMTQRQNQGRRWTYRTYLSRSLEGKVTSSARATRH
jgi:aminopeptidase C